MSLHTELQLFCLKFAKLIIWDIEEKSEKYQWNVELPQNKNNNTEINNSIKAVSIIVAESVGVVVKKEIYDESDKCNTCVISYECWKYNNRG